MKKDMIDYLNEERLAELHSFLCNTIQYTEKLIFNYLKSGHKDMTLHLKFSKEGVLEEVKGEDTYGGIIYYLKELEWQPARLYNG